MRDKYSPLISVIVASYNYEQYIKETLESLLNQTYENFEVIIVDDGSTDNSLEIIKQYTENCENFKLFCHEQNQNKGLTETIKLGTEKASGEYIAFLESDDYWSPNHLETKINFLRKNKEVNLLVNNIETIGDDINDDYVFTQMQRLRIHQGKNLFKFFEHCNLIPTFSCVMVKKELLEKCDFNATVPAWLDYWVWRQLALENKIFYTDYKLTFWRRHKQSYINSVDNHKKSTKRFLKNNNKILIKRRPLFIIPIGMLKLFNFIFEKIEKTNKTFYCFFGLPYLEIKTTKKKLTINFLGNIFFKTTIENYQDFLTKLDTFKIKYRLLYIYMLILFNKKISTNQRKEKNEIKNRLYYLKTQKTKKIESDYCDYLIKNNLPDKSNLVEITTAHYRRKEADAKLIAFYLPQFHAIPLNDKYYGKGFTEWTNVTKAIPHFSGHYQPQLPYDVGFYDLSNDDIMHRQVELAKMYGIYGFCFHYYWFSGTRQLEKPIFNYLNNKELDLPFCLCWANENWALLWDGGDKNVIQPQELKEDDGEKFINDILPFFKDERYIKIDNKPVLIIYRPHLFNKTKFINFLTTIKNTAKENGVEDLYLITANSHGFSDDPKEWGLDALVEFPPHGMKNLEEYKPKGEVNPNFKGTIFDLEKFIKNKNYLTSNNFKTFKSVFTGWDNTARKAYSNGAVFYGDSPKLYKKWLNDSIDYTCKNLSQSEQMVFINAWNEWAEGAHLEPCQKYGYAYLQATKEVLEHKSNQNKKIICVSHEVLLHGAQLIILNIIKTLKEEFNYDITIFIKNSGELEEEFAKYGEVYNIEEDFSNSNELNKTIQKLKVLGYDSAISNTTVMGTFAKKLAQNGIETISLVHELPEIIKKMRIEKQAIDLTESSKKIIFPSSYVANKFKTVASIEEQKIIITPQGIYQNNKYLENISAARSQLRKKYGLSETAKILLNVGFGDHRKGFDLFIETAIEVQEHNNEIYFIWVGDYDKSIEKTKKNEIKNCGANIIFAGKQKDPSLYYAGADLFLLTSREDPFPSVVMEAFQVGVPVVGFKDAGGFADIVTDETGALVSFENIKELKDKVLELINNNEERIQKGENAKELANNNFSFKDYVEKILELF
jgi:glycosyltransferase involved in cell wall biosynthesis